RREPAGGASADTGSPGAVAPGASAADAIVQLERARETQFGESAPLGELWVSGGKIQMKTPDLQVPLELLHPAWVKLDPEATYEVAVAGEANRRSLAPLRVTTVSWYGEGPGGPRWGLFRGGEKRRVRGLARMALFLTDAGRVTDNEGRIGVSFTRPGADPIAVVVDARANAVDLKRAGGRCFAEPDPGITGRRHGFRFILKRGPPVILTGEPDSADRGFAATSRADRWHGLVEPGRPVELPRFQLLCLGVVAPGQLALPEEVEIVYRPLSR
ncbi:MAG: hypothetical protein D6729_05690, partial [Deltaproteobacteria bacterium]